MGVPDRHYRRRWLPQPRSWRRDITGSNGGASLEARHQADLEMMETAALSNAIVASLPLPIAVLDRAGTLISAHDPIATPRFKPAQGFPTGAVSSRSEARRVSNASHPGSRLCVRERSHPGAANTRIERPTATAPLASGVNALRRPEGGAVVSSSRRHRPATGRARAARAQWPADRGAGAGTPPHRARASRRPESAPRAARHGTRAALDAPLAFRRGTVVALQGALAEGERDLRRPSPRFPSAASDKTRGTGACARHQRVLPGIVATASSPGSICSP